MSAVKAIGGILATAASALAMAGGASAEVTIGADVNGPFSGGDACARMNPANRPCTVMSTLVPGRQVFAPCTGTVTRFRINGVPSANTYRLRIVSGAGKGGFMGTATSAAVQISSEGVNEYATSLPIAEGNYIGIDFQDSTEPGLRYFSGPDITHYYFYAFPPDGSPAAPDGIESSYYLFNADVLCAGEGGSGGSGGSGGDGAAPPVRVEPSNAFSFLGLRKRQVILELPSAGAVTIASPAIAKKRGAAPRLLRRSGASGGPGSIAVPLKLTGAARRALADAGKVRATAVISFTPTGGATATQTRKLTVRPLPG